MTKTYKGIEYLIYINPFSGTFCAYIKIPEDHKWIKKFQKKIRFRIGKGKWHTHNDYDSIPISVHGGLTFGEYIDETKSPEWMQKFSKGYWIGWDYAHVGDFMPVMNYLTNKTGDHGLIERLRQDHFWQPFEVEYEVYDAIDQMIKANRQKIVKTDRRK